VHSIKIAGGEVYVDSMPLSFKRIQELAAADGFGDSVEFFQFFEETHGLPFEGEIISWG
jgi:hypothetical protein